MLKNKLVIVVISMLIVIGLILAASFFLWNFLEKKNETNDPNVKAQSTVAKVTNKPHTAAEVKELTVIMKDITTNLAAKDKIVVIGFAFELENKKAFEEFNYLDFKIKGIINQTLADLTPEQISGSKGQDNLIAILINKINMVLKEGKLVHINITSFILS